MTTTTNAGSETAHESAGERTRETMIRTAERLFAERGLGSVSLREIAQEAGQRNSAAVHYHFGGKPELVRAIFDNRMVQTNARRMALLAEMQTDGRASDIRSLLEVLIRPNVELIRARGGHFNAFLVQLSSVPPYRIHWTWDTAESVRMVWRGISRCLELPPNVAEERKRMLAHLVIHTVADREQSGTADEPGWEQRLIDAAEGMLTAPCSA